MKKEGIQTRNRKSSSKSGVAKPPSAGDGDCSTAAWTMLDPLPQRPAPSRPQPPGYHHFRPFPSSSASSDVYRPSLPGYCVDAPPYHPYADAVYPAAYAHAQQVPGDYASIAAFGGAGSFSAAAAGYGL